MVHDSVSRRLLSALAGSAPAFTSAAVTEGNRAGQRLLSALAGSAPAFRSTRDSDEYTSPRPEVVADVEYASPAPEVTGSWFQRLRAQLGARSRVVARSGSVRSRRLAKVEHALQLVQLRSPQAEMDVTTSNAVASLLRAMTTMEQENAVIRVGSIIMIKAQGALVVWTIGEMEAAALEKNSELLSDPVSALKFLSAVKEAQESTSPELPPNDAPNA